MKKKYNHKKQVKKVLHHLTEDSKTWNRLSKEAKGEEIDDLKLIKKLKRKK